MSTGSPAFLRQLRFAVTVTLACVVVAAPADAVILYRTSLPAENTSGPTGELADSGWQYVGHFGGLQGTGIAPRFFITAKHVSGAGTSFLFRGISYPLERAFHDPASDLTIWKIVGDLPAFAPLYPVADEVGKRLVVIGRGRERGADVYLNGTLRGWDWGADTMIQRWGENIVAGAFLYLNPANPLLFATFDADGLADEAHLAGGDSGGAVFIQQGDSWKLAGVNFSVDGVYRQPGDTQSYAAALFDVRGYYERDSQGNYVQITSPSDVPTSFYATRVSSKLGWIYSVIEPSADPDRDGLSNLMEYAFNRNPLAADGAGATAVAREADALTLTYTRVTTATDIQYQVQKSADLVTWEPAASQGQVIAMNANVETVKVTEPLSAAPTFLRVRVMRP